MKTFLRILKRICLILLVILVLFVAVVYIRADRTFEAPLPEISASRDSAVIARGEYLVYGPAHCADCHTSRDQRADVLAGKHVPLHGGGYFDLPFGRVYTHNLTSDATGLLSFSDYKIARSLRYGVAKDGHALLDFMPFHNLSDEDLTAVISFLRTLEPVKYEVPKTEFNFIGKAIKAFMIKPIGPDGEVAKSVTPALSAEYGKYLANSIANCRGCHTNRSLATGEYTGPFFAGGFHMPVDDKPGVFVVSPNLTPDPETGHIAKWSEDDFVKRFREGKKIPDSPMPWGPFSNFSDDDLRSIYRFLHTIEPVKQVNGPTIVVEN